MDTNSPKFAPGAKDARAKQAACRLIAVWATAIHWAKARVIGQVALAALVSAIVAGCTYARPDGTEIGLLSGANQDPEACSDIASAAFSAIGGFGVAVPHLIGKGVSAWRERGVAQANARAAEANANAMAIQSPYHEDTTAQRKNQSISRRGAEALRKNKGETPSPQLRKTKEK